MQPLRKGLCFLAAMVALAGTVLVITGVATPNWVWSHVRQNKSEDPDDYGQFPAPGIDRGHYLGTIIMGLFTGTTYLNWGAGMRENSYSSFDYLEGIMNEGLWISVIVFCFLSIPFGLTASIAAFYNACTVPVYQMSGIFGLYVWNGLAGLFSGVGMILFVVEYYVDLIDGIISIEDYGDKWRSEWVHFNYSFWLVLAAFLLFLVNCVICKFASIGEDPDVKIPRMTSHDPNHMNRTDVGLGLMY